MNDAHLHLIVNHFPIILPFIGLLVIIFGYVFKSPAVVRTAYAILVLSAVFAFASMFTGEGAERVIRQVSPSDKKFIRAHEDLAELLAILSYILGLFSVFALWASIKNKPYHKFVSIAVIVLLCVTLYYATVTGTTGGEVRHSEIRSGAGQS